MQRSPPPMLATSRGGSAPSATRSTRPSGSSAALHIWAGSCTFTPRGASGEASDCSISSQSQCCATVKRRPKGAVQSRSANARSPGAPPCTTARSGGA